MQFVKWLTELTLREASSFHRLHVHLTHLLQRFEYNHLSVGKLAKLLDNSDDSISARNLQVVSSKLLTRHQLFNLFWQLSETLAEYLGSEQLFSLDFDLLEIYITVFICHVHLVLPVHGPEFLTRLGVSSLELLDYIF